MKKYKPTTSQRRAFVSSLRDAGISYEQIAAQAIKQFGVENLPKGYNKRTAWLDAKRELKKATCNTLKTDLRRKLILEYRMAGMSFQQIFQKLITELGEQNLPRGYRERHIGRDLSRYLSKIETENGQELIESKNLHRERLNFLLNMVWQQASEGDFQAIDRVLKITETLVRLDGVEHVTRLKSGTDKLSLNSFADISEHFSKNNGQGANNGYNNE